MFKEPTVLILGAGASVEFGLPSGQQVFQALHDMLVNIKKTWRKNRTCMVMLSLKVLLRL